MSKKGHVSRDEMQAVEEQLQNSFQVFFLTELPSLWRGYGRVFACGFPFSFPGLRNPPRPLLVAGSSSTGSSDSDGGLFAVPTTLPPNSRHGKLFSPSKEAELTFRQHLNSISVSAGPGACVPGRAAMPWRAHPQGWCAISLTDAVRLLSAEAQETAEPALAEAIGGPGEELWLYRWTSWPAHTGFLL